MNNFRRRFGTTTSIPAADGVYLFYRDGTIVTVPDNVVTRYEDGYTIAQTMSYSKTDAYVLIVSGGEYVGVCVSPNRMQFSTTTYR
mgnify:CR=1 FL=1